MTHPPRSLEDWTTICRTHQGHQFTPANGNFLCAACARRYAAEQVAQAKEAAEVFADEKCRWFLERAKIAEAALAQARKDQEQFVAQHLPAALDGCQCDPCCAVRKLVAQARAEEREACERIVEAQRQKVLASSHDPSWTEHFAEIIAAIRAQAAQIAALTEQRDAEIAEVLRARQQIAALEAHQARLVQANQMKDTSHAEQVQRWIIREAALEAEMGRLRNETTHHDAMFVQDAIDDALAPFVALAKAAQMMLDEIHFHFGCDSICETARHVALAHPAVQRAVKEGP